MDKLALFYAPKGGAVDRISQIISSKARKHKVDRMCITEVSADKILEYDKVIFGCSTINQSSRLNDETWGPFLAELNQLSLIGKKVAIYGLGDCKAYPKHFVDSIGDLADILNSLNATLCGEVINEAYIFDKSRALRGDKFLGLPLDEINESAQTEGRIDCWLEQLRKEF